MLRIKAPGPQSTLQGRPRSSLRHQGVPAAGPADHLSMALANWLVGNAPAATAIEITYGGLEAQVRAPCSIGVVGAAAMIEVSGQRYPADHTLQLNIGDQLRVPHGKVGMRTYLAVNGGFDVPEFLGSVSTYLPAGFGGLRGRALQAEDVITASDPLSPPEALRSLPARVRLVFTHSFGLRTVPSAEFDMLSDTSKTKLFRTVFVAGRQATRMGLALDGQPLEISSDGRMKSMPVFPGTIQCPGSGSPIVLLCDAQTTGGYPRIAQIARCDRHLLGQISPGDRVQLLRRSPDEAAEAYQQKQSFLNGYLDGFEL